jgi:hypothetical protein
MKGSRPGIGRRSVKPYVQGSYEPAAEPKVCDLKELVEGWTSERLSKGRPKSRSAALELLRSFALGLEQLRKKAQPGTLPLAWTADLLTYVKLAINEIVGGTSADCALGVTRKVGRQSSIPEYQAAIDSSRVAALMLALCRENFDTPNAVKKAAIVRDSVAGSLNIDVKTLCRSLKRAGMGDLSQLVRQHDRILYVAVLEQVAEVTGTTLEKLGPGELSRVLRESDLAARATALGQVAEKVGTTKKSIKASLMRLDVDPSTFIPRSQ